MLFSDVEGKISDRPPTVSFLDHGFLFGDSLYEVVRVYDRKILGWAEHKERLLLCASRVGINVESIIPTIEKRMKELLVALKEPNAALRMVITRGVGKLHIDWRTCATPNLFMAAWKFEKLASEYRLWVSNIRRNSALAMDPAIKSGNYLNNVLALKEAVENKFDDALMLNPEGEITELTTSNIGWVKNGKVYTSHIDAGILHGVTRRFLLEAAEVVTGRYRVEDILTADEVFVISTFKEVSSVVEIAAPSGQRKVFPKGPVTLKLHQEFRSHIDKKLAKEEQLF